MQCTNGGVPLPTAPNWVQFDSTTISSFLPFPASAVWLGFLNLPVGQVDTAEFCNTEPPDTALSALDITLLGIPVAAWIAGSYDRLANYVKQQAFSTYCSCRISSPVTNAYPTQILGLNPYWYIKLDATASTTEHDYSAHSRDGSVDTVTGEGAASLISGDTATSYNTSPGRPARTSAAAAERWRGSVSSAMEWWGYFTTPGVVTPLYDCYGGTNPYLRVQSDTSGHVGLIARDSAGTSVGPVYSTATYDSSVAHQFDLVLDAAAHTLTLYVDAHAVTQLTGLSTNDYMGAFSHFLHYDNSSNNHLVGRVGQWSWFDNTILSPGVIADNYAAAGGSQLYTPPIYTPPTDGTPPIPTGPTCTSYQDICNNLYTTNNLILALSSRLNAVTARTVPAFYIPGTPVTGLTGHGTLAASDIIGAIVSLTTVPIGWGSTSATPRRLIPSVGSLQFTDGTRYDDAYLLHYEDEIILSTALWSTGIRYNFGNGIVATITPLAAAS